MHPNNFVTLFWICSPRLFGCCLRISFIEDQVKTQFKRTRFLKKNDFFFFFWNEIYFFFYFFGKKKISFFFFFLNKMWSFEQPFWKIIVFKNQTNLFNYEGSRSLNSCNQNLFFSFEHCQIKSSKAIKKWNVIIFRNHIVGWK